MPRPDSAFITNVAQTLSKGEPAIAALRGLQQLGGSTMDAINSGREFLKDVLSKRTTPPGDINLPNTRGRIDPRLKKANPDVIGGLKKAAEGYKTVERLAGKE